MENMKETIKEVIKELLEDSNILKDTVKTYVVDRFDYAHSQALDEKIKEALGDKADKFIQEELDKIFNSPVQINDGWSTTKEYATFEDFARKYLQDKLHNQWSIERMVKERVKNKLNEFVKKYQDNYINTATEEVLTKIANDLSNKE